MIFSADYEVVPERDCLDKSDTKYPTLALARRECALDRYCMGILDRDCDQNPPFQICRGGIHRLHQDDGTYGGVQHIVVMCLLKKPDLSSKYLLQRVNEGY